MKKPLLLIIMIVIGFSVYAQQLVKPGKAYETAQRAPFERISMEPESSINSAVLPDYKPRSYDGSNAAVKKILIGTSRNPFTLIRQQQSCMVYNKDLDLVMGIYRGNDKAVGTLPLLGTGNKICTFHSTDGGSTFTGRIALDVTGSLFRYPSGVIYNPAGNTSVLTAYSVLAGPRTDVGWDWTFLSSMQFNGANFNVQQVATSEYKETYMGNMAACTDGTVHIEDLKNNAAGTIAIGIVKNGKFNATTLAFDWTEVEVQLPILKKPVDGTLNVDYGPGNMAWNKSGSVGYLMFVGVDSTATGNKGRYPIVFKSVNQGATWTKMPYFDFSTFPEVKDRLFSTGSLETDPVIPWFWETDMVVDINDNLHIMALCKGHSSTHGDSLNYYYPNEAGPIYEFSFERNQWLCHYITTPKTHEVVTAESPYLSGAGAGQAWDMRLQASRTDDGKKVFAIWTDTDWTNWSLADSLNLYPDVLIWGRDVVTNKSTKVKNITDLQEGWGECHYMFASPTAIEKAGVYTIPVSISDINTSNLNTDEPLANYYLQGVSLSDADFTIVGNKPASKIERLEVSSYPNPPVNGKTNIVVNLDRSAPVSVVISSVTGQQVSRVNFGTMSAGSQTLPVDAGNLRSGVYFYTVTIGNQRATNKMVIK